jgi:hypothetical protein
MLSAFMRATAKTWPGVPAELRSAQGPWPPCALMPNQDIRTQAALGLLRLTPAWTRKPNSLQSSFAVCGQGPSPTSPPQPRPLEASARCFLATWRAQVEKFAEY